MEEALKRQCQKVGLFHVSQMADGPIEARYEFYTISWPFLRRITCKERV
jgi:hypothetical protein